jgi:serine/threonine-protein kinase
MKDPARLSEAKTMLAVESAAAELKKCSMCGGEFPNDFRVCPRDATPLGVVSSVEDPLLGTVLAGTYRITGLLGAGAMGRLYEAEHARLDRRFAVKVMHETYSAIDDIVARFEREARALSRIRSEHVLEVVDVLTMPDGRPCIIAEKLEGEDLQDKLDREGALATDEAVALGRQICRGLAAAHAHGVVHRDLKPSNLFLVRRADGRDSLKILDFGVAKVGGESSDLTRTGAVVGTPAYMAPEQARGSAQLDHRADIYAVGAVLYRMLTGRMPYDANEPTATLIQVLEQEPERLRTLNSAVPEGLEALIQRAMARDARARPQSATELEAELAVFASATETSGPGAAAPYLQRAPDQAKTHARALTARAKRARPGAVALLVPTTFGAGFAAAACLHAAMRGLLPHYGATQRVIIFVCTALVSIAVFTWHARALRARWRSTPEIEALTQRIVFALVVAACAFGGLELVARAWLALADVASEASQLAAAVRVAAGVAVAFGVLKRAQRGGKTRASKPAD